MILSVSRRTDIPAWYSEWFLRRLQVGEVMVRNPVNFHQVSRIPLSPDVVDGIVFWTKNPLPMMERLQELEPYPYYFQFTLNAYGRDVEPNVPSKSAVLIPVFQELSRRIGRERVCSRYDPILLSSKYTVEYHCRYFEKLARFLHPYTEQCTISFIDLYQNTSKRLRTIGGRVPEHQKLLVLAQRMAEIAERYGLQLKTCAEEIALEHLGIEHGSCIDRERLERIGGFRLDVQKDPNQRPVCGCAAAVDIGCYDACKGGCLYCYADHSRGRLLTNLRVYRPDAPLLCGELTPEDRVTERAVRSCKRNQLCLLEEEDQ